MTPEGRVKAKFKRKIAGLPALYTFSPVQTGMGARTLDMLLCAGGWFIAVEFKVPSKHMTPLQEHIRDLIDAAHGLVYEVSDDESMERAYEVIKSCCLLAEEIRAELET